MIQPMLSTTEDVPRGRAMDVALLAAACVVGAVIRILPAAHAAFPLGDGGLFTSLIEDLLRSGPTLPVTATYNGEAIPYVYPPLAFYLVAALVKGTGVPVLAWMQWLPVAASIAFIPAVYALVRRATRDRSAAVVAAAFIALGNGYQNLVQGGGLTKSLGLVFAVLAIERFLAVLDRQSASRIAAAGALAAAATLSHPAAGPLCAITFAWITLLRWRGGRTLRAALTVALLASLIVLPWAAAVVGHHGLGPLVAAASVDRTLLGALRGVASAFYVHPLPLWTALDARRHLLGAPTTALVRARVAVAHWTARPARRVHHLAARGRLARGSRMGGLWSRGRWPSWPRGGPISAGWHR